MDIVSVTQIAREMGMSRRYILDEIEIGRLKAQKIGNSYAIMQADFEAWKQNPRRSSRKKT